MASAQLSLSTDQYSHYCSVCLEGLKVPVTILCGHSYCMECINKYWDQSGLMGTYRCPQCRMEFNPRPKLHKNTTLINLIGQLKENGVIRASPQGNAEPARVLCDFCTVQKRRASKTCMTCMASYCEKHLQPHLDLAAFKRHKLEEPTENLEEKLCPKHQRVLEIFCRTDEICICSVCALTEHKNHDTKILDEEITERKSQLEKTTQEVKRRVLEKMKKVSDLKETAKRIKISAEKEEKEHKENLKSMLQSIERLKSEVGEAIRDHKQGELSKVGGVIEQLEKEITELRKTESELANLSKTDDHMQLLKMFHNILVPPGDGCTPDIIVNEDFLPETLKKKLSAAKKSLEEIRDFVKRNKTGPQVSNDALQNPSRNDFVKYARSLTLDLNTAHKRLHLSEEKKKVTCGEKEMRYHAHADRFNTWQQILCREALWRICHYWEVEWSGDKAEIGVTYRGIGRKGAGNECVLGLNDKSWSLSCSEAGVSAWHNNQKTDISVPISHRIGVYLDCPGRSLSFYSISDTMTLLHKFKASFTEPLFAGFRVRTNCSVTICPLNRSVRRLASSAGHATSSVSQAMF
ncbi:tripartite motif-containing protein 16-like [Polypterus senegalus]|uniref:tripartite motif-containing protein 16-like n=1 Tax=Polypterus senegalus TaxID=55291 RepID=UPI001963E39E|nr:tripartite motif-containing protein 16-like [Polypterus senegalus]